MKNIVITGGSSGIGLAAARQLVEKGNRVLIAARSEDKLSEAVEEMKAADSKAQVEYLCVDLSDFNSAKRFALKVKQLMPVIDVLALNAGLYTASKVYYGKSGYEMMISTTHLGHFLVSEILLDNVKAAESGRIVVTSSEGHRMGNINIESFTAPKQGVIPYLNPMLLYCQSKLANILFTRELSDRLEGTGVTVNCFHPGVVATGFTRDIPRAWDAIFQKVLISPAKGARTLVYLAESPEVADVSGEYFANKKVRFTSFKAKNKALMKLLWDESDRILADFR